MISLMLLSDYKSYFAIKQNVFWKKKNTTVLSTENKLQTLHLIIAFFVCIFSRIFLSKYAFLEGQNYGQSCVTDKLYDLPEF